VLELLIAAAAVTGGFDAPECRVAFERHEERTLVLRLRADCALGRASTGAAVRALLQDAGATELSLSLGRIERYPWLSEALARQASSSRRWDLSAGRPYEGSDNDYVASALRGMPEFTALFGGWQIVRVSVEKVLKKRAAELSLPAGAPVPPNAALPYDAILWVRLRRP